MISSISIILVACGSSMDLTQDSTAEAEVSEVQTDATEAPAEQAASTESAYPAPVEEATSSGYAYPLVETGQ